MPITTYIILFYVFAVLSVCCAIPCYEVLVWEGTLVSLKSFFKVLLFWVLVYYSIFIGMIFEIGLPQ